MSPQEKLALGISLFVIFFVIAFMVFPTRAYHDYFADLKQRKRGGAIKALFAGVLVLSWPYFYDVLIGLPGNALSVLLQVTMGAFVYILLIDVAWFAYKKLRAACDTHRRR